MASAKKFFFDIFDEGSDPTPRRLCTDFSFNPWGEDYGKNGVFSVLAQGVIRGDA